MNPKYESLLYAMKEAATPADSDDCEELTKRTGFR